LQIEQATGVAAVHPVELVARSLGATPAILSLGEALLPL